MASTTINTRDDLIAYVWQALNTDPDPSSVNLDAVVEAIRTRADVEYGVTTTSDIEAKISPDQFYVIVGVNLISRPPAATTEDVELATVSVHWKVNNWAQANAVIKETADHVKRIIEFKQFINGQTRTVRLTVSIIEEDA